MRIRFFAAAAFALAYINIPAQENMWVTSLTDTVHWCGVVCDDEGDPYAFGTTGLYTHEDGISSVCLTKMTKTGSVVFNKTLDLPLFNLKVVHDGSGLFYFTGIFSKPFQCNAGAFQAKGSFDAVVGCMTERGEVRWLTAIGASGHDELPGIALNADATALIVTGTLSGDLNVNGQLLTNSSSTSLIVGRLSLDGVLSKYRLVDFVPGENGFSGGKELFAIEGTDIILLGFREGAGWEVENPSVPYAGHSVFRLDKDFNIVWERVLMNTSCYYGNYSYTLKTWDDKILVNTFCSEKYGGRATMHCLDAGNGTSLWSRSKTDGRFHDGCSSGNSYLFLSTDAENPCPCPDHFAGFATLHEMTAQSSESVRLKADRGYFNFLSRNADGMNFILGTSPDSLRLNGSAMATRAFIIGLGTAKEKATPTPEVRENRLSVYPNPAFDKLLLECRGAMPERLALVDLQGHEIEVRFTTSSTSIEINVARLPAGAYLLLAHFEGDIVRKKVVIQR